MKAIPGEIRSPRRIGGVGNHENPFNSLQQVVTHPGAVAAFIEPFKATMFAAPDPQGTPALPNNSGLPANRRSAQKILDRRLRFFDIGGIFRMSVTASANDGGQSEQLVLPSHGRWFSRRNYVSLNQLKSIMFEDFSKQVPLRSWSIPTLPH